MSAATSHAEAPANRTLDFAPFKGGGGWVAGDRQRNIEPLFAPLIEAGFTCLSISYRLATHPSLFGAAVEDVDRAVRALGHDGRTDIEGQADGEVRPDRLRGSGLEDHL